MADACTESVGVDAIEFEQGTGAEGRSRRLRGEWVKEAETTQEVTVILRYFQEHCWGNLHRQGSKVVQVVQCAEARAKVRRQQAGGW